MRVKKAMAVGILSTAALLTNPAQAQNRTYNSANESFFNLSRIFNKMFDRLSDEDSQKYYGALFTALNNLDNGEVARWYSDTTGNHGTVEIMATMPSGGQLCRRVYVVIFTEKGKKTAESWACQEANGSWNFSYK
jgi:surface antigen